MKKEYVDIKALSKLARLDVTDEEVTQFENEIPDILSFVDAIQEAGGEPGKQEDKHRNVMRDDKDPHESGIHTDVLLDTAPAVEKQRVKVRRVIKK